MRGSWKLWWLLVCLPALAQADETGLPEAKVAFERAHQQLGNGVDFSPANCTRAEQDLRKTLKLLRGLPVELADDSPTRGFAALELATCRLVQQREREAVPLLREAEQWGSANITGPARACLARLYSSGRGVERDVERALGLHVLADGYACSEAGPGNSRAAAELILAQDPNAGAIYNGLIYTLLQRENASNWLRSLELFKRNFASTGSSNYIPIAMAGVRAGGSSDEDLAAMRALNLELGELFLQRGQRSLAYGYLRAADPKAAAESLRQWQQGQRYRLILADGHEWSATDAVP